MCSNTLYMSNTDTGSSLRWLLASTMTKCHHFDLTSDPEPQNLSQSSRRRLAPPFAHHRHHHVCHRHPTRTALASVIAIAVVGCYSYQCCCHHRHRSSCCCLCCLCRRCLDVSIVADATAALPLPLSFVTDPTTRQLRLAMVPHQRWRWRQWRRRTRRSTTDVTVLTPDAAWTTPSSGRNAFLKGGKIVQKSSPKQVRWGGAIQNV